MSKKSIAWTGVYPAVTTKFHENGDLDIPMFLTNLEAQIAAGVDGIVIGGSLGSAVAWRVNDSGSGRSC